MSGRDYGRVAVVMGGESAERAVSLDGGNAVAQALAAEGVDVRAIDGIPALIDAVREGQIDRVFNLLHGRGGEDGTVQGALECLGVPYTGSRVLGSALSMDKLRSKYVFMAHALPTPAFASLHVASRSAIDWETLPVPAFVKPAREGSSVGLSRVLAREGLADAVALAFEHDHRVIVEAYVDGPEYTVGILDGIALPAIRIEPDGDFYDYHAKYESDETQYHIPCGLSAADESRLADLALAGFAALGCSGWGRADFMWDPQEGPQLIEINTTPGMTSHSLVPKAAAAANIGYGELVLRVLDTSRSGDTA